MKKTILLAAMILTFAPLIEPVHAYDSADTHCHSEGVNDAGFALKVFAGNKEATISKVTRAGQELITRLECRSLPSRPSHPDQIMNYLVCTKLISGDHFMVVRLFEGGIAGLTTASVRRMAPAFNGTEEIEVRFGSLICPHVAD